MSRLHVLSNSCCTDVQSWLIFIDSMMLGSCARLTCSLASCARLQSLQSPLPLLCKNDSFFPQLSQKLAISHLILVEPINMCCELWADQSGLRPIDLTEILLRVHKEQNRMIETINGALSKLGVNWFFVELFSRPHAFSCLCRCNVLFHITAIYDF